MKIYKAINDNDNLLYEREYVGYEKGPHIQLTHIVSSNRVVQLFNPITTYEFNLELIGDNANIGLNHNAKPIPRGNRGVR